MELNYDQLVKDYTEGLHVNLRNFRAGPEFLETWVHDEDHRTSIYGIFEAAECAGEDSLKLILSATVARSLDRGRLEGDLRKLGEIEWKARADGGAEISFAKRGSGLKIARQYAKATEAALRRIHNEGPAKECPGEGELYSATESGVTLAVRVGPRGTVTGARHWGATEVSRAVMDLFCDELKGRSFQECADHGVLRLEFSMRDHAMSRQVEGIITPENADPSFALPQLLIRRLFEEYLKATRKTVERNFWRDPVADSWAALRHEQRVEKVEKALAQACRELGLQESGIEVTGIKNDVRVVLSFKQDPAKPDFARNMIKLERILRHRLEPQMELLLESREDRNKRKERTTKLVEELRKQSGPASGSANQAI